MAQIPGIRAFMTNQPPINLGAGQGGQRALYQFTLQDTDTAELYKYAPIMEEKIAASPGLEDVSSDLLLKNPQVTVEMDRNRVVHAGAHRQPGGERALQRLRHAPGVADLRAEQPVPGHHAGRAGIPEGSGGDVAAVRPIQQRRA